MATPFDPTKYVPRPGDKVTLTATVTAAIDATTVQLSLGVGVTEAFVDDTSGDTYLVASTQIIEALQLQAISAGDYVTWTDIANNTNPLFGEVLYVEPPTSVTDGKFSDPGHAVAYIKATNGALSRPSIRVNRLTRAPAS